MDRIATFVGLAIVFSSLSAPAADIFSGFDELVVHDSFGGSFELLDSSENILAVEPGFSGAADVLLDLSAAADDWVDPSVLPPVFLGGAPDEDYPFGELAVSLQAIVLEQALPEPRSVPEPGTIWLLGVALLGLGYFRRPAS